MDPVGDKTLRDWHELGAAQQLLLREPCGRCLGSLPPTCELDTKVEHLRRRLAGQGAAYRHGR